MHSRPVRLAIVIAVSVAAACGGSGDGAVGGGDPEGFRYEAARACSEVLNQRDGDAMSAARDATLEVIVWQVEQARPTAAEREEVATAIETYRDELDRTRAELDALEPADSADAAAWDELLDLFDGPLAELDRRVDHARSGEGADAIERGGVHPSPDDVTAVLEPLGLIGRDCETLFSAVGPLAAHREFAVAAAVACTTIVSRRQASDYDAWTRVVLDGVLQAFEGGPVERTDELTEALESLAREWEATVADVESVPDDDVADSGEWDLTLDAARERVTLHQTRLELVESGSDDEVTEAFQPGALMEHPGFGSLEALGLELRDCRSLSV